MTSYLRLGTVGHAADTIGIRGIVVHPISDKARAFYLKLGFSECVEDSRLMVVTLKDAREVLKG